MSNLLIKIIIILAVIITGIIGYKFFFIKEKSLYDFDTVKIGNLFQEVSATGTVVPAKKVELQFKTAGKIQNIFVKIGDEIIAGQTLIKLDARNLHIQKQQAVASLELTQAKLNQLLAGESPEQIEIFQTAVNNAEKTVKNADVSLANAVQNFEDVKALAKSNLNQNYEDAINNLNDAELKSYNCFNTTDLIQRTYFTANNQECITVKENKNRMEDKLNEIQYILVAIENESNKETIDASLATTRQKLTDINDVLGTIRVIMESLTYRNIISSTNKTAVDICRTNINTAITSIINFQQTIFLTKLTNDSNINTAETQINTAESVLDSAQGEVETTKNQLSLAKADPRITDIALYEMQIKEAEANLALIESKINDSILRAPINGIIIDVKSEIGEMIETGTYTVAMMGQNEFQIEADISEADIGKLDLAQPVKITLDAFPEQEILGKVLKIDPAETIIQGVVYYKITIESDKFNQKMKSGMTANITVVTDSRENVLIIPQRAIKQRQGKKIIRMEEYDGYKEVEIEIGLRGSNGMIEVLSGLNQGEQVITFIKKI